MGLFPFCSFLSLIFATILLLGYANGQQQSSSRFEGPHNSISITVSLSFKILQSLTYINRYHINLE